MHGVGAGDLAALLRRTVAVVDAKQALQERQHWIHRQRGRIGHTGAGVDGDVARRRGFLDLPAQPAFPDAGFSGDGNDATFAALGVGQCLFQALSFRLAADEARQAALTCLFQSGMQWAQPLEFVHAHWRAQALDGHGAEIAQPDIAFDLLCRVPRQVDATGLGNLFHARGQMHGRPLGGVIHAQVVADLADHHRAGMHAHAQAKIETVGEAKAIRKAAEVGLDVEGGAAGAQGMVFVRDGRAEQRHDAVAGVLVDRALVAVHGVAEQREAAVENVMPMLVVNRFRRGGGAAQIGKQYGDGLAFPLQRAARGQHLVGEMAWCVVPGLAVDRGGLQTGSALVAETGLRRIVVRALRAGNLQCITALQTVARVFRIVLGAAGALHQ